MANVPTQPRLYDLSNRASGSLYYVDATVQADWPYMSASNKMSFPMSWSTSGPQLGSGSWVGFWYSMNYNTNANIDPQQYTPGQGANGSYTLPVTTLSSGNDPTYIYVLQTATANPNNSPGNPGQVNTSGSLFVYLMSITSTITKITLAFGAVSIVFARLPPASSSIGKIFYVINLTTITSGVVSWQGEAIDGFTNGSIRIPQWACISLTPNAAGTSWNIMSYYAGTLPSIISGSVNGTTPTSSIVIANITSGGKTIILPNPSTFKSSFLFANGWTTTTSALPIGNQFAIYSNGFLAQRTAANDYISLLPQADTNGLYNHNVSIFFISDGSSWYIAGIFTGSSCLADTTADDPSGHVSTSSIVLASGINRWVYMPTSPGTSLGKLIMTKMTAIGQGGGAGGGLSIQTTSGTGNIGSTNGNTRLYKNSGVVNYTAFVIIQGTDSSGNKLTLPVSMYPSQY